MGTFTIHPSRPNLSDFLYPIVGQNNNTLRILAKWPKSICPRHFWFANLHLFDAIIFASNLHPFIHHTHRTHYHHITFACACCCVLQRSYFFFLFLFVTPLFPTDIHALSRHKKWREKNVTKANSKSWKKIVCMNQDLKGWGCIMQNEPLRYESYLSGMQTKKSSSPEHIHTPCSVRTVLCCVPTLHYLLRSLHFTNTTKQTFPALSRSFQLYYTMCFVRSFMLKKGNKTIITIGSGKKIEKDMKVTSVNNWV